MLLGEVEDIKNIVEKSNDDINVYKCCLLNTSDKDIIKKLRIELRIPVFGKDEDIRSILEYHSLGQIWILDNKKNDIKDYLNNVLKFSVDILVVDLISENIFTSNKLINNKYKFEHYEISKFYGFNLFLKILFDKILSIFFLLLLSPVLVISIIFIYVEDGFPVLFTQDRTGWDGRRFKIFKLRSLKSEKFDKTVQVLHGDNRLLNVGKTIRRFSIDEIPQFFNVLNGDMSIVGPRPHMVEHDIKYSSIFSGFLKRHKSSPGLTGWAQVNGYRGATPNPELMKKRMEHDLWYLNNWTIWLDIYIIFKTFYIIFKRPG
jgi:putative colanic acid biosynthesis UDP-glucose lipid carrier transferase